jgi:hypothetical protein
MSSHTVGTFVDVVDQSLLHDRDEAFDPLWKEQPSSTKLCEGKTCTMPRGFSLIIIEESMQLLNYLICEVFIKAAGYAAQTLC